jgi:D-aspartate ligase
MDSSTPVLILKSDSHGGLNILRSLGRLGVPVYNLDPDPWAPAFYSKYCNGKFLWDIDHCPEEASVECLLRARATIGRTCILIPTTDRTARFVANHDHILRRGFIFPKQRPELVSTLSSKKEMFGLAKRFEIPTPEASFPQSRVDVVEFAGRARFPVMLKGIDGQKLWERTRKKMFIVNSQEELLAIYDASEDPSHPNLMLQEYIPGGDDTVWMFNGYFNERSECLVAFTGKKIRQCPVYTGSTCLGICLRNREVDELTRRFMKAIGYRGILDIGYRYDARDGRYKVLDANPRIGATFRLFVGENGVDVARALYLDLTGQTVVPSPAKEGRKWLVEDLDLISSYRYHHDGNLTLGEWLASFRGVDEAAFLAADDWMPVLAMLRFRFRELLQRIFHALRRRKSRAAGGPGAKHAGAQAGTTLKNYSSIPILASLRRTKN